MTGREHTEKSMDLSYKKKNNEERFPTENKTKIPPATTDHWKQGQIKANRRKIKDKKRTKHRILGKRRN